MAPIATLTVRLSAQIAEFQSEFREATKSAEKFAAGFEGIATRAAAVGTFIGTIAANIATSLGRAFAGALQDSIRLSSEFTNAFLGLSSVARAFGTDADSARDAARRLSSDGLLPLKDSATGLKNLLATGFNLDQSVQLMNAFKDAAAFGRQGALSFGDAVRSATEGVKNGNSILVDNAGITKNLSQILKEAGFSAQDLSRASSDAAVRMALFNGILKEANAFTGDAQKLTETYAGQLARLEFAYQGLLATIGMSITSNQTLARAIGFVSDQLIGLNSSLSGNRAGLNLVSDAVIFIVRAFAELLNAIDIVQTGFRALQVETNVLFETIARLGVAIFKFTEKALTLQKFLDPVNFTRHAKGAEEARQAYVFLEGAAEGLRKASEDATQKSITFGNRLQEIRAKATVLAKELETTRGKTVEFGESGRVAGRTFGDGIESGSKKATAALKQIDAAIQRSLSGLKIGIPGALPGIKVDLSKLLEFLPPKIPDINGLIIQGFEGAGKLPGIKVPLEVIATPPKLPPTFFEKLFGTPEHQTNLQRAADNFAKGTVAAIAHAIDTGDWSTFANQIQEAISTFLSEAIAAAIDFVVPGLGQLMKPLIKSITDKVVGFFSNIFDRNKGRDLVEDFANSLGGFDALQARLAEMGAEGERLWKKLTQGVGRNNPREAAAAIAEVEAALDKFGTAAERAQRRLDALGVAVSGINTKAELFAAPFLKLSEAIKGASGSELDSLQRKLQAAAQAGQAEFERLGTFVAAAFAGIVKETGNGIAALEQLGPALRVLQQGVEEFGLSGTATINRLLELFGLVNDEVTGPILKSIAATGQIFIGLQDAGFMTAELFQTVAADIGASFRDLEAKGGDVAAAMALSQPILQRLWEAQQIYGEITDETTRKLIKQAEEQGIVGAHMKDVNQKILDVLIAIADVFGAKIPDAIRLTASAGQEAAQKLRRDMKDAADGIKADFANIQPPDINIKVNYDDPGFTPRVSSDTVFIGGEIPKLGSGGIVRRPTLALVGDRPEAIIPLSQLSTANVSPEGETSTIIVEMDGRRIARSVVPHVPGEVRRLGYV